MRTIGTTGEYTLIEEGLWAGTMDKEGKIHISPNLHYRDIHEFVDGIAIACQKIEGHEELMWGLIDTEGNHISEFKYSFVQEWGEGYYRCEIGNKENLLRRDGSEVLKVWFNDVYKVQKGFFIIGNTIRKTKEHPTLYPRGLAYVNGDILYPPMFNVLKWNDEVTLDFFYAEKEGKPYFIYDNGFIDDPSGDQMPKLNAEKDNFIWNGPKGTICNGCIFTDGINEHGEGCRKLNKEDFRNNVIKCTCEHYKKEEQQESYREYWDKYDQEKAKDKDSKIADTFATKLVKDFIKDKLDGDIMHLRSFNFMELRDDEKYGDCGGYGFTPEKSSIMKSIMALTSTEAWPGITYDAFDHYDYEAAPINTYSMLLGLPLGEEFKGMTKFRPSADELDRAWAFHHLCYTIGNYMVLPWGISMCREKLRRPQRYIDTYLHAIYLAFTNPKKGNSDLLSAINKKKKIVAQYRSEEGFADMCKKILLQDYIDCDGKPMRMFEGVWSDQKDLTRDAYFKALDEYVGFCEMEIPMRTNIIIERLMKALGMESPQTEPEKIITLDMPEDYKILESMPDDPQGSISYGKSSSNAQCFLQTYPIAEKDVMPLNDTQPIIDGIHESLADNQGIVEVENGKTQYDKWFVYSIVKSARKTHGMNYILTMHLVKNGIALCIKGLFEERGETGYRDTTVYAYALREKKIKEVGGEGWFKDPYDEEFTRGCRMNLSESRDYDHSFPDHPLTQIRKLISYIIQKN